MIYRPFVVATLIACSATGCSVVSPSVPPSARGATALERSSAAVQHSAQPQAVTLDWQPDSITMVDGGPYVGTTLAFTHGDTVVVNYDTQCDYRVDFQWFTGPVKKGIEYDPYWFYAYTNKIQPPFHCRVQAQLKDSRGHVIAQRELRVTINYPKHHSHGG